MSDPIVQHLLDACDNLLAACRDLASAKLPLALPGAQGASDGLGGTFPSPEPTDAPMHHHRKDDWTHIDTLVDLCLEAPREWHSTALTAWQQTPAGFKRVCQRLRYVAKQHNVRLTIHRKLDTGDPGDCVNVCLRGGGAQ